MKALVVHDIFVLLLFRSDDSDEEIGDDTINKILIVMQTPPAFRKHPGGDRTGDHVPRSRMTADLAKVINDGLMYYEQDLWEQDVKVSLAEIFSRCPSQEKSGAIVCLSVKYLGT